MRSIIFYAILLSIFSCNSEVGNGVVVEGITPTQIIDSSVVQMVDDVTVDTSAMIRDSTRKELGTDIIRFIDLLRLNEFAQAQKMLHPDGLFYFTVGRILPNRFNLQGLKESTGLLEGAYSYGLPDEYEMSDSTVNGLFWLDSIRNNYDYQNPTWYSGYAVMAYGFTGNFSSDHIEWRDDWPETTSADSVHIAYMYHKSAEIESHDVLMVEFFQDKNMDWKIYAIGNLEWTP